MDKKQLHHLWTKTRRIKVWHLAVVFFISATIGIFALRQNNLTMVELRAAVYDADEQAGDVEQALQNLRKYVHSHMNTDLTGGQNGVYPPIQLKYTYQRLQQVEKDRVKQNSAQVYTDAQTVCERQNPTGFSGRGRIPCIEAYVSTHTVAEKTIPDALYKFSFASPSWSPDLAGFSVLIAGLSLALLVLRVLIGRFFRAVTR